MRKYTVKLVFAWAIMILMVPFVNLDAAPQQYDAKQKIVDDFRTLEAALNNKRAPMQKVHVLHNVIHDQATFQVSVSDQDNPNAMPAGSFQIDKADYINSFLLGGHYVTGYAADIEIVSVDKDATSNEWTSRILLKETGQMMQQDFNQDNTQSFLSFTVCESVHGQYQQITASTCDTTVSYMKHI